MGKTLKVSTPLGLNPSLDVSVLYGTDVPGAFNRRFGEDKLRNMALEVQLSAEMFRLAHRRAMKPSERLHLHQEILYREIFGVSPRDAMAGRVLGYGPQAGHLITKGAFQLSAIGEGVKAGGMIKPHELEISEEIFRLGSGADTKGGGSSSDMAPVTSPWDNGLHGQSSGVVPAPQLAEMLRVYSRGSAFLPMAFIGFAPDLTFEQRLRTNSLRSQLFEGANLRSLKAGILPRKEKYSGTAELRPTFGKTQYTTRGYMFHSPLTLEVLTSRAGGIIGIENEAVSDLVAAPAMVGEYDIFQAVWNGIIYGYTRRFNATGGSWDISTNEVPFGKAEFINAEARRHWVWFDVVGGGKFYPPKDNTNYFKYQSSSINDLGPMWRKSGDYKTFDALRYMATMLRKKGKRFDGCWMSVDALTSMTEDDRCANAWYDTGDSLPLTGESGYVGTIKIPGSSERVAIFTYDEGGIPALTDADGVAITDILIGGELSNAVSYAPFWPLTVLTDAEYLTTTVDSRSVTRRTLNNVLTAFSMECVEPVDLRNLVMVLVPGIAHT